MWDLIMYAGLALIGWMMYCLISDKSVLPFLKKRRDNRKRKNNSATNGTANKELNITMKELLGIKAFHGNLVELIGAKSIRTFVGAVKCEPINYLLRSLEEQADTDRAYEHLLASLSLGPGREVEIVNHLSSRPIDLGDQLAPYREMFPTLDPIAQRYASNMFFPFLEQWQQTVDEFDYQRYIIVILRYTEKMLDGLDDESVIVKASNEFGRLASNIRVNYKRMGGTCKICTEVLLYEAIYFAINKQSGKLEHFRSLVEKDGVLSPFICSDYTRSSYRYLEEEEDPDGTQDAAVI